MASFDKGPNYRDPFGKNVYLRSTRNLGFEHGTFAKSGIPTFDRDGIDVKELQPGTVLARITSGADEDKLGVFDDAASDGRQTAANIVGVCDTFVPWQLYLDGGRDVDVAYVVEARIVQENCFEYESGVRVALDDATAAALVAAAPGIIISHNATIVGE